MRISDWSSDVCSSDLEVLTRALAMLLSPRRPDQPDSGGASSHRRSQQMAGCTPVFGAVALLIGGAGIAIAQTSPETTSRTIELPTMEVTPVPRTKIGRAHV